MRDRDIDDRTFAFACEIVRVCMRLERRGLVIQRLSVLLLDSGTSIGANCEEGAAGYTKADFIHKHSICLKEARETRFWLRLIIHADPAMRAELESLLNEATELSKIFGAIVRNAKLTASRDRSP